MPQPKEKLDADKISGVTSPLSAANFTDVLAPDTQARSVRPDQRHPPDREHTLDGFTYAAQVGQKQADNYPVTFTLTANLPPESAVTNTPPAPGAKPDDQAKAAADAKAARKTLTDKLTREQQYQHWIYLVPSYTIDPLLKPRGELLVVETNTPPAPATTAAGGN